MEILYIIPFIFTLITVFVIDNSLVNGVVSSKNFWFFGSIGLVCISTLLYSYIQKNSFRPLLIDKFVLIFTGSILMTTLECNDFSLIKTKLVVLALLLVLFFNLRIALGNAPKKAHQIFCLFIVITGLVEAIWGLMQLYGFTSSHHYLFNLTGSFFNPGPFAGYLSVIFPLSLFLFFKNNHLLSGNKVLTTIRKWICGLTCFAIMLILPATISRAAWLSTIAGSIVVVINQWREIEILKKIISKFKRKALLTSVLIFLIFISFFSFIIIYHLKKDSADGRLLVWKVSLAALVHNPFGVGLGYFPSAYGDAQVAYFGSGNASEVEEYVAGNTDYAFNEFLQIAIESGIISLLFFWGILICAFRDLLKSDNYGVIGSLVALLVFSCFSYPFRLLPFLIIFVFLLAMSTDDGVLIQKNNTDKKIELKCSLCALYVQTFCIIVTTFCIWKQYPIFNSYKQWKGYQYYFHVERYKEVVNSYEPLYLYLNDQIKFLFEYGLSLSLSDHPERSNEVLKRATQISCDPMLYNIMGKNYQAMKEFDLAEKSFRKASLIVQNRIYPHYLLMKLYIEIGDDEKAKAAAQIVLTKKPKVMSTAVMEMREEARLIDNGQLKEFSIPKE